MKNFAFYMFAVLLSLSLLQACGQEEVEVEQQDQQAIEDSLEQVRQAEQEQLRRDSLEQARADSIAAEEERSSIEFSEDGQFVVQIGAWRSEEKAHLQAEEWKERGYDRAFVITTGNPDTGNVWYRVRIGQFETRDMADRFRIRLLEEYDAEAWVSRLN